MEGAPTTYQQIKISLRLLVKYKILLGKSRGTKKEIVKNLSRSLKVVLSLHSNAWVVT